MRSPYEMERASTTHTHRFFLLKRTAIFWLFGLVPLYFTLKVVLPFAAVSISFATLEGLNLWVAAARIGTALLPTLPVLVVPAGLILYLRVVVERAHVRVDETFIDEFGVSLTDFLNERTRRFREKHKELYKRPEKVKEILTEEYFSYVYSIPIGAVVAHVVTAELLASGGTSSALNTAFGFYMIVWAIASFILALLEEDLYRFVMGGVAIRESDAM